MGPKPCKEKVKEERPIEVCCLKKPCDLGKANRKDRARATTGSGVARLGTIILFTVVIYIPCSLLSTRSYHSTVRWKSFGSPHPVMGWDGRWRRAAESSRIQMFLEAVFVVPALSNASRQSPNSQQVVVYGWRRTRRKHLRVNAAEIDRDVLPSINALLLSI